ncbi:MAG: helix-turn-helix transcriptional regulator [Actinomycetota bacterium]
MASDIEGVALLDEPVRRRLFDYVRGAHGAVGREEAGAACGVSRALAAFHLDRLAAAGLLDVEFRRLTGRTGRGAGRPAKLYRPSATRLQVAIPPDRVDLAGELLATAMEERRATDTAERAVRRVARREGVRVGRALREPTGDAADPLDATCSALADLGFEPDRTADGAVLRNCPFHDLARRHTELVCAMNHALLGGLVAGLTGGDDLAAELRPGEEACCVAIVRRPAQPGPGRPAR